MAHTPLFQTFVRLLQEARRANLKAEGKRPPLPPTFLSRRRFMRSLTLASGAAVTAALPRVHAAWGQSAAPKIAIIGGGIAGLNAAYHLKRAGFKATVYEARARLGGRIHSVTGALAPGLVSDLGGSLINTDHADILALVKTFKLQLFNRRFHAQHLPFPSTAYFFDQSIRSEAQIAEALRPLARQIGKDAALLDRNYDQYAPQFDLLSVAQYLTQHADKIPKPFIRELIENTIRTEYGVEPENSSALQLLFLLPTVKGQAVDVLSYSDEVYSVQGGSGKIIEGLVHTLPGQIQTRMRLTQLHTTSEGFKLVFANGKIVRADYVVLAMPFTLLRQVKLAVDLPSGLRQFIEQGNLGFNDKLFAGFSRKIWLQKQGFSQDIWTDLGFAEAWDDSQRQTQRPDGALNFYLGGDQVQALDSDPLATVGHAFVKQLNRAIPGAKAAATGKFLRTQWSKDSFSQGAYATFAPGQLTAFSPFFYVESKNPSERQDVHVGNLVFAGEQVSDAYYGFMNGGAQTGRLAARVIVRLIRSSKR
ncbi:MAG TPA: NAD(P)/FAD-dependent oxidoreductase [Stenomitos sp.]